ncbi:MAG: RNA polymerase factor sigma-54 [Halieaceae bacterium]|jgi:RNA polymerase sigma-54 factor|nr:RNA polymerase factor sigma-54 [Halieaceae bacterium]
MKLALQLKLGQQLTMTPQLQQAIRLLQLSTLDLQQEIQQTLESNPLLEIVDERDEPDAEHPGEEPQAADRANETEASGPLESMDEADTTPETANEPDWESSPPIEELAATTPESTASESDWENSLPDELPIDTKWEDVLPSSSAPTTQYSEPADTDFEGRNSSSESLQDSLLWQLNLTRLSDIDKVIAMAIIDATDDNGRLTQSCEEILEILFPELDVELDEVVAVLHRLQQFEPAGVCASDLQECLLVQLQLLPRSTPWLEQAKNLVSRHMSQLGNGDFKQILRRSKLNEDEFREVLSLIRSLNPFPGQSVGEDKTEYVVPDVFVSKKNDHWVVELNPDTAPKLRINNDYASLIKRADNSSDNTFLKDNLQEARWFLKSLLSRNETLMKVSTKIIEHQRNFLEYGEEAMKPLVLRDIAEAVEMHESTISRVTTNKYMHTPRGIFELKYFFSSHVGTAGGGTCSSTAIRALIKKLVAAENPRKPLSDNKITQLLEGEGITVARRTVAKYRETLFIPPSNERKRLV